MDRVTHEGYASLKTTLENVRNTMYDTTSVSKSIAYSMLTRIVLYYSNSTSQTPSINSRCRAYRQGISYEHCLTLPATEVIYEEPHIQGGTLSRGSSSKTRHFYYDDHSRLTLLKESYNDGWTSVYSWQNDFTGNVLKHTEEHYNNQHFDSMVITYTYDKRGRRRTMTRNLNGVEFAPVSYDYDAFGRMRVKKVEGRGYEVYGYNLQGWQDCSSAYFYGYDLFSQTMTYQHPFLRESEARYDGLVSEVMYRHLGQDTHTVAYGYDGVGRLASSCRYLNRDSTACHTWSEDAMEYDLNGNLIFMARINNNHVEDIWKEYQGNRMIWSSILGNGDNHYDYYADGNLKTDPCRNLQIQYNMLNLPAVVTEADGQSPKARYYYFADGSRYRVYDASGNGYVYRGTFVYNLSPTGMERLESVGHDEGRFIALSPSAATTQFIDTWHVKDYLGNVRVVLDITNDTSVVVHPSFAVLEQDDYLPFGTRADLDSLAYDPSNRYRFNGKEEQVIGNIGLIDYGARFYDPDLSRWTTPDPLAEKYYSISPYAFCNNNPVNFVDLDGRDIWHINKNGVITWEEESEEHRLYSIDSYNNRSDNYVIVANPEVLKNLEGAGVRSYTSINGLNDIVKVFKFAADNSDVEWALHQGASGYSITTSSNESSVGNWENYGIEKPIATIHSHPNIPNNIEDEVFSMGFLKEGPGVARALIGYDWDNVRNDIDNNGSKARKSYVYFPISKSIYYVTYNGPKFIKRW